MSEVNHSYRIGLDFSVRTKKNKEKIKRKTAPISWIGAVVVVVLNVSISSLQ